MSYERLELVDGVTKWDTEKVQHLEDAIIKNENDIQKYHNDTIVDVQADWDQSDNTAKNYVKNRTHYKDIKEIIIAKGFETETYETMRGDEGYEEMMVVLTNTVIPCTTVLNSKEEMEKLKVNINGQPATIGSLHHSQDFKYASWLANNEIWIDYSVNKTTVSWQIRTNYKANLPVGEQFIIDIYTERVEYMPLDEKYLPASVLEQPDWKCNDTDSSAYIKNRTHYDYWVSTDNYIYNYDSPDNPGHLPYIFEVAPTESDFLGGHGFFYNGFLFNSDSDWEMIGEEYDEDLGDWKTKYECQQIKHHPHEGDGDEILTMTAITYSQYDVDQGERKYFVSIDCTFKGYTGGIVLCEAEMRSKTLDKRFLADFTVAKDWSVNDENDSGYINNRTHYQYLDYTKRLYWEDPILGHISKLPYTETIRSYISSDEAPGYWLGENKYLLNDHVVDAYSNWEEMPESDYNYKFYQYNIRINEWEYYNVTAKVVYNGWGNDSYITWLSVSNRDGDDKFGKADIHYKQLDPGYLPDGVARNPDWNEGDDNSPSYIDNKPFYEYQEKRILVYEGTIPSKSYSVQEPIVTGGKYLVTVNGVSEEVSSWYSYESDWEQRGFSTSQLRVFTNNFIGKQWAGSTDFYVQGDLAVPYTISIEKIIAENELKQLDEKFIPDTIARVADIPIILDTTLTKEGAAADAKVVGEAISKLTNDLESLTWSDLGEHVISEDRVEIIEIDEKYIPEVIARTSDLTNLDTKVTGDLEALENKVDNKQIEDYFEQVNERLLLSNNEYGLHEGTFYLNDGDTFSDYPITLKIVRKSDNATLIFKEDDDDITIINMAMITDGMTSPKLDSIGIFAIKIDRTFNAIQIYLHSPDNVYDFYEWELSSIKTLDEKYISDSIARAPKATLDYVTETPTAEQYNALLDILKQAGILI